MCRTIGEHGLTLVKPGDGILTHCNAGQLATCRYGTATAPVYLGQELSVQTFSIRLSAQDRLTAVGRAEFRYSLCLLLSAAVMMKKQINCCDREKIKMEGTRVRRSSPLSITQYMVTMHG